MLFVSSSNHNDCAICVRLSFVKIATIDGHRRRNSSAMNFGTWVWTAPFWAHSPVIAFSKSKTRGSTTLEACRGGVQTFHPPILVRLFSGRRVKTSYCRVRVVDSTMYFSLDISQPTDVLIFIIPNENMFRCSRVFYQYFFICKAYAIARQPIGARSSDSTRAHAPSITLVTKKSGHACVVQI